MQNGSPFPEPSRVETLRDHPARDVTRAAGGIRFAWVIALGVLSALGLAGCASTNMPTESASIEGSAWGLASLPGRSLVPDATPTARFEAGRVFGSDGCNRYSMPFTVQATEIQIGPIGPSTRMACPESTMAQAEAFTTALITARGFRRGDATLELLDANGAVLATLTAQARSLAGTSWDVININNGRQAVVGMVSDSTVTMAFDNEGRVSGTTGCNRYTAAYHAEGDTLRFSSVAATRMACADPAVDEQEQAFLRALESVATLSFEGDRLDMRDADGALAIILVRKPL
jgi:heat shock protein HslJ